MARPLTIGLLTPGWPGHETPNGIATAVYHLATGLAEIGEAPVILAMRIDGETPAGIPVVEVGRRGWTLAEKIAARLGRRDIAQKVVGDSIADAAGEAVRRHRIDVLIAEETQGWAHRLMMRGTVPVVVTLHGPWILHKALQSQGSAADDLRRERREAAAFRAAAGLLSPSRNVLDAVEAAADVGAVPRMVIPNAFGPTGEGPPAAAGAGPGGPVLFVGRFDRHKGGDTALAAFGLLQAAHPGARLSFAGPDRGVALPGGGTLSVGAALAALPGPAQDAVRVLGRQGTAEVAALRRSHPVALIASRYENLNYTLLEAMAAGQAIVCTRVGGPAEVLEDGQTALLVPPDDPPAMAAALGRLLADPALALRLGTAARARIASDFRPDAVAARTADFLRSVLNRTT